MPGIVTHYLFGTDVYREAAHAIGVREGDFDAFLLGNQGPDPLFYLRAAMPAGEQLKRIGQTMHRCNTADLIGAMHERFVAGGGDSSLSAYALGFLCHYILDSTVHPLVYAQQHAIASIGIGPLKGAWPHRVIHATIETSIDEYMLTTRLGAAAATAAVPPHSTMLRCPAVKLMGISKAMADVISGVYGISCPDAAFASAVGLNRVCQTALDSKSPGLHRGLERISKGSGAAAYVQALSHRSAPLPRTPFTNDDHTAWPHPFKEGHTVDESFDDLYAASADRARELLPSFARQLVDQSMFAEIVRDVSFLGRPVLAFSRE